MKKKVSLTPLQSRRSLKRRAFTLAEVIISIGIVTVMASAVIVAFQMPRKRATTNTCSATIELLNIRAANYHIAQGRWPSASMSELYPGEAVPRCPVDNSPFRFNRRTGTVQPHRH